MVPSLPDPQFAAKLRDVGVRCQRALNAHLAEARPLLERLGVPKTETLHMLLLIGSMVGGGTEETTQATPKAGAKPKQQRRTRRRRAKAAPKADAKPVAAPPSQVKPANSNSRPKRTARGGVKRGSLMPGSKMAKAVKFAATRQAFKVDEIVSALGISRDDAHKLLSAGRKNGRFTKMTDGNWRAVTS